MNLIPSNVSSLEWDIKVDSYFTYRGESWINPDWICRWKRDILAKVVYQAVR